MDSNSNIHLSCVPLTAKFHEYVNRSRDNDDN